MREPLRAHRAAVGPKLNCAGWWLDVLRVRVLPCVLLLLLLLLPPEGGDRGGGQDADGRTGVHLPVLRCVLQHRRRRGSRHPRMVLSQTARAGLVLNILRISSWTTSEVVLGLRIPGWRLEPSPGWWHPLSIMARHVTCDHGHPAGHGAATASAEGRSTYTG